MDSRGLAWLNRCVCIEIKSFLRWRFCGICEPTSFGVDNRVGAGSEVETDTVRVAAGVPAVAIDTTLLRYLSLYEELYRRRHGGRLGPARRHWARDAVGRLIPLLHYRELPANDADDIPLIWSSGTSIFHPTTRTMLLHFGPSTALIFSSRK